MGLALNAEQYVCNTRQDASDWYKAVKSELDSLEKNKTWNFISRRVGKTISLQVGFQAKNEQ